MSFNKIIDFYTYSQVVNVNNNVNNNNNNLNGINANTNVQDSNNANANNNAANVILGSFIDEFMKLYFRLNALRALVRNFKPRVLLSILNEPLQNLHYLTHFTTSKEHVPNK